MNKQQLEVLKASADDEKKILHLLKVNYAGALRQVEEKIAYLMVQEQTQSKIYQLEYQKSLQKQLTTIINSLNEKNYTSLEEYLKDCYDNGFIGVMYDIQNQGIPVTIPINQEEVLQMVRTSPDGIKLSKRLYSHLETMKEEVIAAVSASIAIGDSWEVVAKKISNAVDTSYNNSIRIARTEGHRVQNQAAFNCQQKAKSKGADVVKQWDSTLDGKTRTHHIELDGQIKEIDEPFEVASKKAMFPGNFGDPSEDCNCRCAILQRSRKLLGGMTSKMVNFTDEALLFKNESSYEEFKKFYFSNENIKYMNYVETLENRYKTKNTEQLLKRMTDKEYQHYKKLLDVTSFYQKYPAYQKESDALLAECEKDDSFTIHI